MATYPGSIPSIPGDGSWTHDDVANEIEAIATELGANPKGDHANVAARLASRGRSLGAGRIYHAGPSGSANAVTTTAGQLILLSFPVDRGTVFAGIRLRVSTAAAGASFRVGVYADSSGAPGSLLAEASLGDGSSSGYKAQPFSSNLALTEGLYWVGLVSQGGNVGYRGSSGVGDPFIGAQAADFATYTDSTVGGYVVTGVTGPLPDPCPTPGLYIATVPRVGLEVAA